jgi:hypothetical protein
LQRGATRVSSKFIRILLHRMSSPAEGEVLQLLEKLEVYAQNLGGSADIPEPRRSYWTSLFHTLDLYGDRLNALRRMAP